MTGRQFFLYLLIILNRQSDAFLNEVELKISAALMKDLRIDNRILVEEPNSKPKNLQMFKSPMFWNKATSYQNTKQIFVYFRKTIYPHRPTLIIFKVEKITSIVNLKKTLAKKRKSYLISKFTWLVFVESYKLIEKYEKEFLIPLDSEFIIAFPVDSTSYRLLEIYKVKSKTVKTDFGTWNEEKLDITKVSWYWRRWNFKNETLVMGGLTDYGQVGECKYSGVCAFLDFLNTMSTAMNFRLEWVKFSKVQDIILNKDKGDLLDGPYDTLFHSGFAQTYVDVTGQVYRTSYNWYIKEPTRAKLADYYLQPFATQVWALIIITSIIGGVLALFLNYSSKTEINKTNLSDEFFIPFDCICNQEGAQPGSKSSSRILCFSVRFLALFIMGAYSATVTSFSAVQEMKMPFRNVEEFLENGKYTLGFCYLFEKAGLFPEDSPDPIRQGLRKKVAYFESIPAMGERLCADNFALVGFEADVNKVLRNHRCAVQKVENPLFTTWLLVAVLKNSPYKKSFNYFLLYFYSSGIDQRIFDKATTSLIVKEEMDFDYVEFEQTVQILGILAIGVLISVVIYTGEILFSFARKNNTNPSSDQNSRRKKLQKWK